MGFSILISCSYCNPASRRRKTRLSAENHSGGLPRPNAESLLLAYTLHRMVESSLQNMRPPSRLYRHPAVRDCSNPDFLRLRDFSFFFLVVLIFLPACARASTSSTTINACGATIDVEFRGVPDARAFTRDEGGEAESLSRRDLLNWINSAAVAVCGYYGQFPVRHFSLLVKLEGRAGVHSGTTFPRGEGFTRISVGPQTTVAALKKDWMMTHEMIHLAFPSMADSHHWIEEGIATYVEPVARVQAGQLSAADLWSQFVRDMPQGEPQPGDRGLDQTHTWGRTYWGGAHVLPAGRRADQGADRQSHGTARCAAGDSAPRRSDHRGLADRAGARRR